jgi:hypothetical protein
MTVMAMITCSECGRAVSNKAAACIGCGAPLSASPDINFSPPTAVQPPPTTAQIKRRAMVSLAALLTGVVWAAFADPANALHRLQVFLAALLIIGGICGLLVTLVHSVNAKS